jgi:hypothetical protein
MAIEPTASLKNIKDSLKKYIIDEFVTNLGYKVTFDTNLLDPNLHDEKTKQWFVAHFGSSLRSGLSVQMLQLYCCTRKDVEGDNLIQLADDAFEKLTDSTQVDAKRRIDFYDSSGEQWSSLGQLIVGRIDDSDEFDGPDDTKYRILSCQIRWVAKA